MTKVLPYLRRRKEPEGTEQITALQCKWCKKQYASPEILSRHDAICLKGRRPDRLKCRLTGCNKHYDTERRRNRHEENCTVYACSTEGCTFVGRDKQDADKHSAICTRVTVCKCGTTSTNSTKTNTGCKVRTDGKGRRIYPGRIRSYDNTSENAE